MQVKGRQRQILELLLRRRDEMTAGEIAEDIRVSVRTVHRELAELETLLAASGVTLQKKSGRGIQLQAEEPELEALRELLASGETSNYSSAERKVLIVCALLKEPEPVKLFALAHDLGVTVATVSHDLDELESWIERSSLKLVRRRGYGIEITGPESRMRDTIRLLARNHLDDDELFGHTAAAGLYPVKTEVLALMGREHMPAVEEALWNAEEGWLNELSESDYTDLLIRLTVAVNRIRQGKLIERGEEAGAAHEEYGAGSGNWLTRLSEALGIDFPPAETRHLIGLVEQIRNAGPDRLLPEHALTIRELVQRLTERMEAECRVPFGIDRPLREGLVTHLEHAVHRLEEGATIRNPLLALIKRDYEPLFAAVRKTVNATIPDLPVPDEEIGFLVMHFGASVERLKQPGREVRALIVCTSGIGSANMLAVRLGKEFPQIRIVGNSSWFEAPRIPQDSYDFMISTVDLPIEAERYIKLSPLLTKEETDKLRSFIQEVTLKLTPANRPEGPPAAEGSLERLVRLQSYLSGIVSLVGRFEVYELDPSGRTLEDTLREACGRIAHREDGGLHDAEAVVQLLIERQRASSQLIPDTRIALFHTRSESIDRPSFNLFRLTTSLELEPDGSGTIDQLLLMLAPRQLSKESLEILSEISSLLLNEALVSLLETGRPHRIRSYLAQALEEFIIHKKYSVIRRDLR
ncbi:BglG family transcription antiterminator [Paenibacillus chartarius]|uniref:BglG family transcription antiterminator n=1 Tax=Paenibacillus chartarius TaxID=747481 RepID=A0ABV6DR22_9BACL